MRPLVHCCGGLAMLHGKSCSLHKGPCVAGMLIPAAQGSIRIGPLEWTPKHIFSAVCFSVLNGTYSQECMYMTAGLIRMQLS